MGEPAEPLYHRDVSVKDFVEDVQRIIRRQLFSHPLPFLHAQKLVVQRLGVSERQAQEHSLGRAQASAHADTQPPFYQTLTARIRRIHPGCVAVHVAGELVEHDHKGH